jgi:ribosomal protein S10
MTEATTLRQPMPFVTTIHLESGDRHRLESVVDEIKGDAARKGAELKGPHPEPPRELRVPQSKTLGPGSARFPSWNYTVYARTIEIVGHEEFAREIAGREYPPGIHVEVDIDQRRQTGL